MVTVYHWTRPTDVEAILQGGFIDSTYTAFAKERPLGVYVCTDGATLVHIRGGVRIAIDVPDERLEDHPSDPCFPVPTDPRPSPPVALDYRIPAEILNRYRRRLT